MVWAEDVCKDNQRKQNWKQEKLIYNIKWKLINK